MLNTQMGVKMDAEMVVMKVVNKYSDIQNIDFCSNLFATKISPDEMLYVLKDIENETDVDLTDFFMQNAYKDFTVKKMADYIEKASIKQA